MPAGWVSAWQRQAKDALGGGSLNGAKVAYRDHEVELERLYGGQRSGAGYGWLPVSGR